MEKALHHILEGFPECRREIIELFNSNENFRSLCEDYLSCLGTLTKFQDNILRNKKMETEYKLLSLDLKQEVLHYLQKQK